MSKGQLKSGVYLSYISLFVTNISNLILTPFIIRSLGDSEYGLYMLIGAFVGYIAVLDFGLENTIVRFVAKYRAENNRKEEENFLFATSLIYLAISTIVLLLGIIIYFNLTNIFGDSLSANEIDKAKIMFIILVINLALTLPMKSFTGIITAYEKFVIPRALKISRTLVRMLVVLIVLALGYKAIAIVLIDAILNLLIMFISMTYVFIKLKVKIRFHYFNLTLIKNIFSYSSLIFISVIVDQIYWRIGHLILGIVASTSEVAVFAIGMMFGQYFITFSTAISGVFLPKITAMVVNKATGEELTDLLIKTGRLQFIILSLILGGFIIIGKNFITLWAGSSYVNSWLIGIILMIPLLLVLTQTIGISILQAKNMHGFRAFSYLVIAIFNTFISIFLAKSYGAFGAAMGTSLSLILGNIIMMNLFYYYKVQLNIPRFFRELMQGLLLAFIISLGIGSLLSFVSENSWISLVFEGGIYTLVYVVIVWIVGMNKSEKILFKREMSKLKKFLFDII